MVWASTVSSTSRVAGLSLDDIDGVLHAGTVAEWKAIATERLGVLSEEIGRLRRHRDATNWQFVERRSRRANRSVRTTESLPESVTHDESKASATA